ENPVGFSIWGFSIWGLFETTDQLPTGLSPRSPFAFYSKGLRVQATANTTYIVERLVNEDW
ncbi:hypothetical protein HAX54_018137, partial [Datura stramonium]|nr:hypothetical protein [Datura stramonium]